MCSIVSKGCLASAAAAGLLFLRECNVKCQGNLRKILIHNISLDLKAESHNKCVKVCPFWYHHL